MSNLVLVPKPQDATRLILKKLSSRRMRDVLEKRFGLKGGRRKTLEAIGAEYRITRERVRQIEADALKQLGRGDTLNEFDGIFQDLAGHIRQHGGVMAEGDLIASVAAERAKPCLIFLLSIAKNIHDLEEDETSFKRWAVDKDQVASLDKIMAGVARCLEERKQPVTEKEMEAVVSENAKEVLGRAPEAQEVGAYLATSRVIGKNPYGEYGLASWAAISPRGIKDKAYAVLAKEGKPLHFREVAKAVDRAKWSAKRAHPQTVHNELIKDARFVLVGRGLYALREWGYEPGVVRDVMVSILKGAGRPLVKEDIIRLVSEKRMVKPQTVLLNLQNKSLFRKTEENKYTLV